MTKLSKAHVVTLSVVTAGLILVIGRETRWRLPSGASEALFAGSEESDQPTDTINRMMDAARDGDVDTYIECFGGQMKKTLQQSVAEMSASGFARYLMKNNEPIKGFAMYEPLEVSASAVDIRVEYVYADRNEAQRFRLERLSGRWTITKLDGIERVETIVPYGTPVY